MKWLVEIGSDGAETCETAAEALRIRAHFRECPGGPRITVSRIEPAKWADVELAATRVEPVKEAR